MSLENFLNEYAMHAAAGAFAMGVIIDYLYESCVEMYNLSRKEREIKKEMDY